MIHSPTVLSMKQKPCTGYLKNIIQPVFREYNIHRFQRITGVKLNCRGEEPSNCHIFQSLSWNKRGPKPLERGDAQM